MPLRIDAGAISRSLESRKQRQTAVDRRKPFLLLLNLA
jgi:hypothetical protein